MSLAAAAAAAVAATAKPLAGSKRKGPTAAAYAGAHAAAAKRAAHRAHMAELNTMSHAVATRRAAGDDGSDSDGEPDTDEEGDDLLADTVRRYASVVWSDFDPTRPRGTFVTEEDSIRVLRLAVKLLECGSKITHVLDVVAATFGFSPNTTRKILRYFAVEHDLYFSDAGKRGKMLDVALPPVDTLKTFLNELVRRSAKVGSVVTTTDAQKLISRYFHRYPSTYIVRSMFHELGMAYGKIGVDWAHYISTPRRDDQIFRWLVLRDWAAKEEAAGRAIVVYTDELYVDTDTHERKGFHPHDLTFGSFPKGTGRRIVLLHAFTKDGMLVAYNDDGTVAKPSIYHVGSKQVLFGKVAHNCLGMFVLQSKTDYHVTSDLFQRYLQNVLLPTAKARYPDRRIIIMMDNASSHHGRSGEGHYSPGMSKSSVLAALRGAGCTALSVPREPPRANVVVNLTAPAEVAEAALNASKSAPHRPLLRELQRCGRQWIRVNKPRMLLTDVQRWAIDNGLFLLFTVPYLPPTQPIEFVWGTVKNILRHEYSVEDKGDCNAVMHKIEAAFATAKLVPGPLVDGIVAQPAATAAGYVRHTLDWANEHLFHIIPEVESEGGLGTLELPDDTAAQVVRWTTPGNMDVYFAEDEYEEEEAEEADTDGPAPGT
jgi:hypothetical protein